MREPAPLSFLIRWLYELSTLLRFVRPGAATNRQSIPFGRNDAPYFSSAAGSVAIDTKTIAYEPYL